MPNWAIYSTLNNRVKSWITSSPIDPVYPVGPNEGALKDPNVSQLAGVPLIYWKQAGGALEEMTQGEKDALDAEIAAAAIAAMRSGGITSLSDATPGGVLLRAFADITKDEINNLRQWIVLFKAQVALASNLANLQTRVATLPDMPDRTLVQLRNSIENRIDSGNVDA